jgi:serine/threonine-protein kinase
VISLEDIYPASDEDDSVAALSRAMGVNARLVLPVFLAGQNGSGEAPSYVKKHSVKFEVPGTDPESMLGTLKEFRNPLSYVVNPVINAPGILYPAKAMASKTRSMGFINVYPDRDGVVRHERLVASHNGRFYNSLAIRSAARLRRTGEVAYDSSGRMALSFSRDIFPSYSLMDVAEDKVKAGRFRNKLVLIGHDSSWTRRYRVPFGPPMSALEIRANAVHNILEKRYLYSPRWAFAAECAVFIYFGLIAAFIMPRTGIRTGGLVVLLSVIPVITVSSILFVASGFWIKVFSPSILLALGYLLVLSREFMVFGNRTQLIYEHNEANCMLGLEFQSRGMLDMALEKYMKCRVRTPMVQEHLYNLAQEFERKRMAHKATGIYRQILRAGRYRDSEERLMVLEAADASSVLSIGGPARRGDGTMVAAAAGTLPTLGRYEVSRELGRGAMGIVYLGKDPTINREVAIKTLLYDEIEPEQIGEIKMRFFQEAEAAGKLSHPNILTIFDAGEEHDMAYLAMEVLDGVDLKDYCNEGNLLPLNEVLRIVAEVADALDYAHENGVVHRDIKPANIMLLNDGTVKVTDFGIARVVESSKTQTGMVLGTPSYMSPEQVDGKKVDGRSDLFSLGATMYELLTAQKAFTGESVTQIMYNITNSRFTSLDEVSRGIPPCVSNIVEKLMSKTLTRRYRRGSEVAVAIAECLHEIA